jgi:hypothetical protein
MSCVLSIHCDKSDHRNYMQSGICVVQIIDSPFERLVKVSVFWYFKRHIPVEH